MYWGNQVSLVTASVYLRGCKAPSTTQVVEDDVWSSMCLSQAHVYKARAQVLRIETPIHSNEALQPFTVENLIDIYL